MFVSAGWTRPATPEWHGRGIAGQALRAGILLAPGEFYSLRAPQTAWFRFNVAYASEPLLLDFLLHLTNAPR
jgi:DNA-binding transcriptional MocR family regulator